MPNRRLVRAMLGEPSTMQGFIEQAEDVPSSVPSKIPGHMRGLARAMYQAATENPVEFIASMAPVTGEAISARDAMKAYGEGDWPGVALGALGAIPALGMVGKIVRFAPEGLASKVVPGYNPPKVPERHFSEDYKGDIPDGPLQRDIDGRPLHATYIAGRRSAQGVDTPLTAEEIVAVAEGSLGTRPQGVAARAIGGNAGKFVRRRGIDGPEYDVYFNKSLPPEKAARTIAHEVAHGIDHLAGELGTEGVIADLRRIYNDLNNPSMSSNALPMWPEHFGYKGKDIERELIAEAIRAYMTDPNYVKTVSPKVAEAIRAAVNANPRLNKTIQFNVGAPLAAGALGLGLITADQAQAASLE